MCGIWFTLVKGILGSPCPLCRCLDKKDRCHNDDDEALLLLDMLSYHERRGPDTSTPNDKTRVDFIEEEDDNHCHLSGHTLWTQGSSPLSQPFSSPCGRFWFLFNGDIYSQENEEDKENDGLILFQSLISKGEDIDIDVLSSLRGPFAFLLLDTLKRTLWFGRDYFGRVSLLFSTSTSSSGNLLHLSSVSTFPSSFEVPCGGVYEWALDSQSVSLHPFVESHQRDEVSLSLSQFSTFLHSKCALTLVIQEPKIPLTFKVAFLSSLDDDSDDVLNQLKALSLKKTGDLEAISIILQPYISKFLTLLRASVARRVLGATAPSCTPCLRDSLSPSCSHPKAGILFSGGLDSTVLAFLALELVPEIVLCNVAFSKSGDSYDEAPDRITALQAYEMLRDAFPSKKITLELLDVPKEDVQRLRRERIRTLISPLKSVLDDSLGVCLWFAASKAGGTLRTLLLGSGADELLGGYSRHRGAFETRSWPGLGSEMQRDLDRISIRNLGRDNRVLSDHGLAPRLPYLDEDLVSFLSSVPLWVKCCPLFQRGLGEKLLLRCVGFRLFGPQFQALALFPKRAMQFGSRIAKLEDGREKGGQACQRLL